MPPRKPISDEAKRQRHERQSQKHSGVTPTTNKERKLIVDEGPLALPVEIFIPEIPSITAVLYFVDNEKGDEFVDMDNYGNVSCSFVKFDKLPIELRPTLHGRFADRSEYRILFATIDDALQELMHSIHSSISIVQYNKSKDKKIKSTSAWNVFWVKHAFRKETRCSPLKYFLQKNGGPGFTNHSMYVTTKDGKEPDFRNNLLEMARMTYKKSQVLLRDWPNTYPACDKSTTTAEIERDFILARELANQEPLIKPTVVVDLSIDERKEEKKTPIPIPQVVFESKRVATPRVSEAYSSETCEMCGKMSPSTCGQFIEGGNWCCEICTHSMESDH